MGLKRGGANDGERHSASLGPVKAPPRFVPGEGRP